MSWFIKNQKNFFSRTFKKTKMIKVPVELISDDTMNNLIKYYIDNDNFEDFKYLCDKYHEKNIGPILDYNVFHVDKIDLKNFKYYKYAFIQKNDESEYYNLYYKFLFLTNDELIKTNIDNFSYYNYDMINLIIIYINNIFEIDHNNFDLLIEKIGNWNFENIILRLDFDKLSKPLLKKFIDKIGIDKVLNNKEFPDVLKNRIVENCYNDIKPCNRELV